MKKEVYIHHTCILKSYFSIRLYMHIYCDINIMDSFFNYDGEYFYIFA